MSSVDFVRIGSLKGVEPFRESMERLAIHLPCDDEVMSGTDAPLAQRCVVLGRTVGNRFAIQPMEGWDGTADGHPTDHTFRRWRRFGSSGAKLIWGGEAVAVRHDGRANPNQLVITSDTQADVARLRGALVEAHRRAFGSTDDLLIGLQLTHSGRFARPNRYDRPEPVILYHHPFLDRRVGIDADYPILEDGEIRRLEEDYVRAAQLARDCGFDFVDVKQCHGYLGHEFLSARTRPGPYGGPLENRLCFFREVAEGIRSTAPGLGIATRISTFDTVPHVPDPDRHPAGKLGTGIPEDYCGLLPYEYGFGVDREQPLEIDLREPLQMLDHLRSMDVNLVNVTGGSPYYSHHYQRPALYPPSDGYQPPEDPLEGVARHITITAYLKRHNPDMIFVGSAYTYLQEFLPNVAQALVRDSWVDFVGLGRMVLAYPELPADVLSGRKLDSRRICRTFSDCTTAPRAGLVSGCYPLDPYYGRGSLAEALRRAKAEMARRLQ